MAWNFEMELNKGIYCLPGRTGFVGVGEHGSWEKSLRSRFRKGNQPFSFEELIQVDTKRFSPDRSKLAFGTAGFLMRHHPEALLEFASGCVRDRIANERQDQGHGSWTPVGTYQPPAKTQCALLEASLGDTLLDDLEASFLKGSRYKPRKKSKKR
ncbi:MAG: hypothetical protein ACI9HE_003447 [Planctomycetota bacterium]|jgi:hypothetical protein